MSLINIFNYECDKLLGAVDLFRSLLPSDQCEGSIHNGEEGLFVENLVIEFLRKSLPSQLEVTSGFVVSSKNIKISSGQIDIIVYDRQRYAPIMKYGDAVVIHDNALVAAISIKKKIKRTSITDEFKSLSKIGAICGKNGNPKPYLAVFALDIYGLSKFNETTEDSFKKILDAYPNRTEGWSGNEIVDDLIVLNQFIIKKKEWKNNDVETTKAKYIMCAGSEIHRNIYLQHLLNGISKVIKKINNIDKAILVEFPKINFQNMGYIEICTPERPYKV